jgi:nucleoid DNA-binding protein
MVRGKIGVHMQSKYLTTSRGPEIKPKISTRDIITEVAEHTGVSYSVAADVVYAFLHYIRYAAYSTNQRVIIRGFGSFGITKNRSRMYGAHMGTPVIAPDRIKLSLTSNLLEVDRWKSMQSIQKNVLSALGAALKPHSMDLVVCARIADLVISSNPIATTSGSQRLTLIRSWITSMGASPLLPAITTRRDLEDREFNTIRYRLRGHALSSTSFDYIPSILVAASAADDGRDIIFTPSGWSLAALLSKHTETSKLNHEIPENKVQKFGLTIEENCKSLYMAYRATKYGKI